MNWHDATLGECWDHLKLVSDKISLHDKPTLDAIRESLPWGWRWKMISFHSDGCYSGVCCDNPLQIVQAISSIEILACARAACLAWEASGK